MRLIGKLSIKTLLKLDEKLSARVPQKLDEGECHWKKCKHEAGSREIGTRSKWKIPEPVREVLFLL